MHPRLRFEHLDDRITPSTLLSGFTEQVIVTGLDSPTTMTVAPDGRIFVTSCQNQLAVSEDGAMTWRQTEPPPWNLGFKFTWPAIYVIGTNELGVMVSGGEIKRRLGRLTSRGS